MAYPYNTLNNSRRFENGWSTMNLSTPISLFTDLLEGSAERYVIVKCPPVDSSLKTGLAFKQVWAKMYA